MVEAGDEWQAAIGEVYSTSPANKAKDAWLQRTVSQAGQHLGAQRDRLFEWRRCSGIIWCWM
jgi:hypothetical protein